MKINEQLSTNVVESIILDLSFMPKNTIPPRLLRYHNNEVTSPYITDEMREEILSSRIVAGRYSYLSKGFIFFEEEMREYAIKLYRHNKYHLAKKCFSYLIKLGAVNATDWKCLLAIARKSENKSDFKKTLTKLKMRTTKLPRTRFLGIAFPQVCNEEQKAFNRQKEECFSLLDKYIRN